MTDAPADALSFNERAAIAFRRERDRHPANMPWDRGEHARELWKSARTPELRDHLMRIYPKLFAGRRP
jgi:hypothetical protein